MIKNLLTEWSLRKADAGVLVGIGVATFVLGLFLQSVMQRYQGDSVYIPLGTLIAAISICMTILVGFAADFYLGFTWAVTYGKTRKDFLLGIMPVYFLISVLLVGEVRLLLEVEKLLWKSWGVGGIMEWSHTWYLSFPWIFLYALLFLGAATTAATLIYRFRTKAAVILLIFWILIPSAMRQDGVLEKVGEYGRGFTHWPPVVQVAAALGVGVTLCSVPYWGLRRAEVK